MNYEGVQPSESVLQKFNSQLRTILRRHNTVVETMAEALIELKQSRASQMNFSCEQNIQARNRGRGGPSNGTFPCSISSTAST
jgi:hypothetical protein